MINNDLPNKITSNPTFKVESTEERLLKTIEELKSERQKDKEQIKFLEKQTEEFAESVRVLEESIFELKEAIINIALKI